MTWIKKQLLLRAITMTGILISLSGTVFFVNNHIPFTICFLSIAVIAIIRSHLIRHKDPNSHQKFWALHIHPTYPIGDEREQHLILSAGYIAGQITMGVAITIACALSLANTTALTVSIPVVVAIIISIMIVHEWLVIGFYWYLSSK